jgi:hypothetical protein
MNGVENLYKMRVQAGTWKPAMPKQQVTDLAALASKIEALNNAQGRSGKTSGKVVRNKRNAWKFVVPKDGETKSKTYEGREYHWCPKHGFWTMHKPEDCTGIDYKQGEQKNDTPAQANIAMVNNNKKEEPLIKVNNALRAYIESTDNQMD